LNAQWGWRLVLLMAGVNIPKELIGKIDAKDKGA
jgi:hypothetical protein